MQTNTLEVGMKFSWLYGLSAILLTGCTSTHMIYEYKAPLKMLDRDYAVVIQTPADGYYEQRYARSGIMTAETLQMNHITSVVLEAQSKWATLGGDHPQDLLPKSFDRYLETIYE
jgi:hypothetical protein